jgi:hypothetical protein
MPNTEVRETSRVVGENIASATNIEADGLVGDSNLNPALTGKIRGAYAGSYETEPGSRQEMSSKPTRKDYHHVSVEV